MASFRTRKTNTLASLLRTETISTPKPTMPEKNNSCRSQALILNMDSKKPAISYFLIINFPKSKKPSSKSSPFTKVRIKIPKLLVKTIKPGKKKKEHRNSPTVSVQKLASMLSKTFVCRKPGNGAVDVSTMKLEKSYVCDLKDGCVKNVEEFGSKSASEYSDSYITNSIGSPYSLSSRDHLSSSALFEIPLFNGNSEIENECEGKEIVCPTCKRPLELKPATRSFFTKAKSVILIKDKNNTSGRSSCSNSSSTNVTSSIGRGVESKGVSNKSSSKSVTGGKVESELDEEQGDKELWKKKIIMGRKNKVSSQAEYWVV